MKGNLDRGRRIAYSTTRPGEIDTVIAIKEHKQEASAGSQGVANADGRDRPSLSWTSAARQAT
jgi:hypothetical protein